MYVINRKSHLITIIIVVFMLSVLTIFGEQASFAVRRAKKVLTISNSANPFKLAYDIAIDKNTNTLYVPNAAKNKVQAYDADGNFLFEAGETSGEGVLKKISGLWVDRAGKLYVVSEKDNKVVVFDRQGSFVFKFDTEPNASDVVTNSFGDIYVAINDFGKGKIVVYDNEGKYKFAIKKITVNNDDKKFKFGNPAWICMTSDDKLIVSDDAHKRIFIFDSKGKLLTYFGGKGDTTGKFYSVTGVEVDSKNRIYVVDRSQGIIQIFTNDGEFLYAVSNEEKGSLALVMPTGIAFDSKQRLYILEGIVSKIDIFDFIDK